MWSPLQVLWLKTFTLSSSHRFFSFLESRPYSTFNVLKLRLSSSRNLRLMAGTGNSITPHVIGSTFVELSRSGRTGAPFSVRISTKSHGNGGGGFAAAATMCQNEEGPSCIFVGPLETASKETLEALYRQVISAFIVYNI